MFADHGMGLSSFNFFSGGLRKTHRFCKGAYRPFKVIHGHWFWYQSKARMRLLISPS